MVRYPYLMALVLGLRELLSAVAVPFFFSGNEAPQKQAPRKMPQLGELISESRGRCGGAPVQKLIVFAFCVSCYAMLSAVLFHAGNTQASSLVEEDWLVPGDGLLTKDLNTGLKWLDLSETLNQNLEQLSTKMEPGGPLEGFWLSSTAELDSLYVDAGLSAFASTAPGPWWSTNPAVVAAAEDFLDLVGVTMAYTNERGLGGRHAPLYWANFNAMKGANLFVDEDGGFFDFDIETTVPTAFGRVACCQTGRGASSDWGYFLVTPEPSTASLLTLGLVGIAAVRRRRAL